MAMGTDRDESPQDGPMESRRDFRALFEAAWRAGALSSAEPWMYMYSVGPWHYFKHGDTREYRIWLEPAVPFAATRQVPEGPDAGHPGGEEPCVWPIRSRKVRRIRRLDEMAGRLAVRATRTQARADRLRRRREGLLSEARAVEASLTEREQEELWRVRARGGAR